MPYGAHTNSSAYKSNHKSQHCFSSRLCASATEWQIGPCKLSRETSLLWTGDKTRWLQGNHQCHSLRSLGFHGFKAFGLVALRPMASWYCTLQAQLQNTYLGDISLIATFSLKAIDNSLWDSYSFTRHKAWYCVFAPLRRYCSAISACTPFLVWLFNLKI